MDIVIRRRLRGIGECELVACIIGRVRCSVRPCGKNHEGCLNVRSVTVQGRVMGSTGGGVDELIQACFEFVSVGGYRKFRVTA